MKLNSNQLHHHLKKDLLPAYWISGDETLIVEEALDLIRQTAKNKGFNERELIYADQNFDWESMLLKAKTFSIFSNQTILEIHLQNSKLKEEAQKVFFSKYLESPPPDKILLLKSNKLESSSLRTRWFQALEKKVGVIQVWPVTAEQLPQWIKKRLQSANLQVVPEGIQLLSERGEGNLLAVAQTIEKLSLLYSNKLITLEDVTAVVADNARYNVFDLIDYILLGDTKRVMRIIRGLKGEGTEPILILWALAKELRALINVSYGLKTNAMNELLRKNNIWEKRKPACMTALKRSKLKLWFELLQNAAHIDRVMKGAAQGNVWDELQQLALTMTGVK